MLSSITKIYDYLYNCKVSEKRRVYINKKSVGLTMNSFTANESFVAEFIETKKSNTR